MGFKMRIYGCDNKNSVYNFDFEYWNEFEFVSYLYGKVALIFRRYLLLLSLM